MEAKGEIGPEKEKKVLQRWRNWSPEETMRCPDLSRGQIAEKGLSRTPTECRMFTKDLALFLSDRPSSKSKPLSLLKTAQGHPTLELKNGETYNGHLVNCDTWMNIHLREVICTSKDAYANRVVASDCRMETGFGECLNVISGEKLSNTFEYRTRPTLGFFHYSSLDRKPPGVGRGRGRGIEDGPGRQSKGSGRGMEDGIKGAGGRGRGGPSGKTGGKVSGISFGCGKTYTALKGLAGQRENASNAFRTHNRDHPS
ncbi:hypothetical protein Cgig2_006602 [Carnegiea gigantea]|uniref:Sm domain-containing protein n=1 Tax=Carnegiea gigantea TaxID=171969 RepID=A0A9Q1KNV2_9CARY|nr:hypothetical protein Cgig2_006602 [Carnegiea gigantea]